MVTRSHEHIAAALAHWEAMHSQADQVAVRHASHVPPLPAPPTSDHATDTSEGREHDGEQ